VTALVAALDGGADLVVPGTRSGAGTLTTPLVGLSGKSDGSGATAAGMAADDAVNSPLNFARVGAALLGRYPGPPPASQTGLRGGFDFPSERPAEGYSAVHGLRLEGGKYGAIKIGEYTHWGGEHIEPCHGASLAF
jgi:hypothetical protein